MPGKQWKAGGYLVGGYLVGGYLVGGGKMWVRRLYQSLYRSQGCKWVIRGL